MTEIERKALALLHECGFHGGYIDRKWNEQYEAICRAIERIEELEATEPDCSGCDYAKPLMELQERHEAFRREVSDAVEVSVKHFCQPSWTVGDRQKHIDLLTRFILPKPVDPLVEAIREMSLADATCEDADRLRAALAARGLEIREVQP